MDRIPFNKPYFTGRETEYIGEAISRGTVAGCGGFTDQCTRFFEDRYGFGRVFLTTSCTSALEMAALLLEIKAGDEVIMPSYTFVSTANAFVLRGANILFVDSTGRSPHMDVERLEELITPRTRAIVPVHYCGVGCDMEPITALAQKHGLTVVEDAASGIDSFYRDKPLGSMGRLAAFSFHETKNIISGEGGLLAINDERLFRRAEILWEKGTNRAAFMRGETDRYVWMEAGSSFSPSDISAACLWAQIEKMDEIKSKRMKIWEKYREELRPLENEGRILLSRIPDYSMHNAHLFYLRCANGRERDGLIRFLDKAGIKAVFHYLPLHKSPFYRDRHDGRPLPESEGWAERMVRLPLFCGMTGTQVDRVVEGVLDFFSLNGS